MLDPIITCPHCKGEVKLTEAMAAPLVEATRRQFQKQIEAKDATIAAREAAMEKREQELEAARQSVDSQVETKLAVDGRKSLPWKRSAQSVLPRTTLQGRRRKLATSTPCLRTATRNWVTHNRHRQTF